MIGDALRLAAQNHVQIGDRAIKIAFKEKETRPHRATPDLSLRLEIHGI